MSEKPNAAFTIIELLIVIVVIGILAAISTVAYSGIANRAVIATISSDLKNSANKLEIDKVDTSIYAEDSSAFPKSVGTEYQYMFDNTVNPPTFCLTATSSKSNSAVYHVSNDNQAPTQGPCPGHHAPIVYTFGFTVTGGTSTTSSSSVDTAFTWDKNTISALEYQRYWLYDSCTGPSAIISPGIPMYATGAGSATTFQGWGNLSGMDYEATAALWVRVRAVDSAQNPLTEWSDAKGVAGKFATWSNCSLNQSPWVSPLATTTTVTGASVSNLGGINTGLYMASVTHYAKTTAANGMYSPPSSGYWYADNNYRIYFEKIVYMQGTCVGATPLASTRNENTGWVAYDPINNKPSATGPALSHMRIGLAVANPSVGAVWARAQTRDASGTPLGDWSVPYGVITKNDLSNSAKPISFDVCDPSSPPPLSHWPSI